MSSTQPTPSPTDRDLRSVMMFADQEAERLLAADGPVPLDAVAWLSVHIAAVGQAVYPVLRSVTDGGKVVDQQRKMTRRLVPRVERQQIAPGRWGSYLLGRQHDSAVGGPPSDRD